MLTQLTFISLIITVLSSTKCGLGVSSDDTSCSDLTYINKFTWYYDWTTSKHALFKAGCRKDQQPEYVP